MTFETVTKQRIINYVKQSKLEVKKFNKTKKIIFLEQASEKIYNAYILFLEYRFKTNIKSHADVVRFTKQSGNKAILDLGLVADSLHKYFYESGSEFFIKRNLNKAWSLLGNLVN